MKITIQYTAALATILLFDAAISPAQAGDCITVSNLRTNTGNKRKAARILGDVASIGAIAAPLPVAVPVIIAAPVAEYKFSKPGFAATLENRCNEMVEAYLTFGYYDNKHRQIADGTVSANIAPKTGYLVHHETEKRYSGLKIIRINEYPESVKKTAAAAPTNEPVTLARFDRIAKGMTYGQVLEEIGSPGEEMQSTDLPDYRMVTYTWKNSDASVMFVTFQNDKMIMKSQYGLK